MDKKGQILGMPFSVMFSIILIIFFIIAAIIAIKIFYNPGGCGFSEQSSEGLFKQDFQDSVNNLWASDGGESSFKINLPSSIKKVCFLDASKDGKGANSGLYNDLVVFSEGNLYLYPGKSVCEGFASMNIQHINVTEITKQNNPYCIDNGKNITLEKGFYDSLVKIK